MIYNRVKVLNFILITLYSVFIISSSIFVTLRVNIAQFPYYFYAIDLSDKYMPYLYAGVSITNRITIIYTFLLTCLYSYIFFKWRGQMFSKIRFIYFCIFTLLFILTVFIRNYMPYDLTNTYRKLGAIINSILFWHYPVGSILFYLPSFICFKTARKVVKNSIDGL